MAGLILIPSLLLGAPESEKISDEALLDLIQRQSLDYFLMESNPANGLVRDRANNFSQGQNRAPASIAAVGFALTAYAVGVSRDWMDRNTALERTRRTLDFFLNSAPHKNGFFYHFMDMTTGKNNRSSEVSPIDTTLFLAGALFAAEYYEDAEIRDMAMKIYERVDWTWLLHGGETLVMAWSPSSGFTRYRWDHYDESMIMYFLAIASPTHPIPASSWKAIKRPVGSYGDHQLIQMPPLFTHQYSHIWVDFRNKNDGFADYFQNSVSATLANRQFAIDQSLHYKTYSTNSWGLTASDGPSGYKAYGAPPGWADHDGTVAPTACGSSIVFTPKESLACLRHFYETHQEKLWGKYGFSDAFNLQRNWFSSEVLGIDQGPLILMIENYRSELIWKTMSKNVYLKAGMDAVGFKPGTIKLPWPDPPQAKAAYWLSGMKVDGFLRDWPNGEPLVLDSSSMRSGQIKDDKDLKIEIRFVWDENFLYFYLKAIDDSLVARKTGKNIWMDDTLELFIDPHGDGLYWKNLEDFQLGFSLHSVDNTVATWSWFQDEDPSLKGEVEAQGYAHETGYLIEARISWNYLGIRPKPGMTLNLSPAFHDLDADRTDGKLEWFFRNEAELKRFELGKVILQEGSRG